MSFSAAEIVNTNYSISNVYVVFQDSLSYFGKLQCFSL